MSGTVNDVVDGENNNISGKKTSEGGAILTYDATMGGDSR